ncbi:MAG TPA: hypothetical protein VJ111_01770 [Chitinophagaceae bacterium]|nr:hypothetical protein [Chitinophagaceae bacterium]
MIEYSEDIEASPVKKKWKKKKPLTNTMQSPAMDKSIKGNGETNKADEIANDFSKWIMPSQPQAYIKCPHHDFF